MAKGNLKLDDLILITRSSFVAHIYRVTNQRVVGQSMSETLESGTEILVNRFIYKEI